MFAITRVSEVANVPLVQAEFLSKLQVILCVRIYRDAWDFIVLDAECEL